MNYSIWIGIFTSGSNIVLRNFPSHFKSSILLHTYYTDLGVPESMGTWELVLNKFWQNSCFLQPLILFWTGRMPEFHEFGTLSPQKF